MDIAGVDIEIDVIRELPELEDLEVNPSVEEQNFNSNKYGFKSVKINAIKGDKLELNPSLEQQNVKGVFTEVNINPIQTKKLNATPTTQEQVILGLFDEVTVNAIEGQELNLNPSEEQQNFEGVFLGVNINPIQVQEITTDLDFSTSDAIELTAQEGAYIKKATINKDVNLSPENIKSGVTISGISGDVADTSDADATSEDIVAGKTAYVANEKVQGTFVPLDTSDATATAEDIAEGKTAYSNGEKLTGTLEKYNLLVDTSVSVGNGLNVTLRTILVKANGLNYSTATCPQGFSSYYNLEEVSFKTFNETTKQFYNMFSSCTKLKKVEGLNPVKGENFQYMFSGCSSLEESPEFETPCATDFKGMFNECTSLKKVICYNTSKLHEVGIEDMFNNCPNLTDESLDNIMYMCKKASKTTTKTLAYVGLSEEQATRCQSLSNYQAFLDAGWTTGF